MWVFVFAREKLLVFVHINDDTININIQRFTLKYYQAYTIHEYGIFWNSKFLYLNETYWTNVEKNPTQSI